MFHECGEEEGKEAGGEDPFSYIVLQAPRIAAPFFDSKSNGLEGLNQWKPSNFRSEKRPLSAAAAAALPSIFPWSHRLPPTVKDSNRPAFQPMAIRFRREHSQRFNVQLGNGSRNGGAPFSVSATTQGYPLSQTKLVRVLYFSCLYAFSCPNESHLDTKVSFHYCRNLNW